MDASALGSLAIADQRLQPLARLGEGTYACVLAASIGDKLPECEDQTPRQRSTTRKLCAIKIFKSKSTEVVRLAKREARAHARLNGHPNIVRLEGAYRSGSGRPILLMEYCPRDLSTELCHYPRGMPGSTVKVLAWQLVHALLFLHSQKYMHRDLKPSNLLLTEEGVLKLCDFGLAREVPRDVLGPRQSSGPRTDAVHDKLTTYVVTRWYRAPEVLLSKPYGTAADIWSLGCTVAELAMGAPLLPGKSTIDQMFHIWRTFGALPRQTGKQTRDGKPLPHGEEHSDSPQPEPRQPCTAGATLRRRLQPRLEGPFMDFLEAALRTDPDERATAEELLQMPYFADIPNLIAGTALEGMYERYHRGPAAMDTDARAAADDLLAGVAWGRRACADAADRHSGNATAAVATKAAGETSSSKQPETWAHLHNAGVLVGDGYAADPTETCQQQQPQQQHAEAAAESVGPEAEPDGSSVVIIGAVDGSSLITQHVPEGWDARTAACDGEPPGVYSGRNQHDSTTRRHLRAGSTSLQNGRFHLRFPRHHRRCKSGSVDDLAYLKLNGGVMCTSVQASQKGGRAAEGEGQVAVKPVPVSTAADADHRLRRCSNISAQEGEGDGFLLKGCSTSASADAATCTADEGMVGGSWRTATGPSVDATMTSPIPSCCIIRSSSNLNLGPHSARRLADSPVRSASATETALVTTSRQCTRAFVAQIFSIVTGGAATGEGRGLPALAPSWQAQGAKGAHGVDGSRAWRPSPSRRGAASKAAAAVAVVGVKEEHEEEDEAESSAQEQGSRLPSAPQERCSDLKPKVGLALGKAAWKGTQGARGCDVGTQAKGRPGKVTARESASKPGGLGVQHAGVSGTAGKAGAAGAAAIVTEAESAPGSMVGMKGAEVAAASGGRGRGSVTRRALCRVALMFSCG